MNNQADRRDVGHVKFTFYDIQACVSGVIMSDVVPDSEKRNMVYVLAGSGAYFIRTLSRTLGEEDQKEAFRMADDLETIGLAIGSGKMPLSGFLDAWNKINGESES